jgi:hypothetical protein
VRSERRDHEHPTLVVSEVKWKRLSAAERREIEAKLSATWARSTLHRKHPNVVFEVLDSSILKGVRRDPR